MNTRAFSLPSGDLASRSLAIPYRLEIEKLLSTNNRDTIIQIDLEHVESISESYADELFGMLVKEHGIDTILDRMKIVNADDFIISSIASVIQRRATMI